MAAARELLHPSRVCYLVEVNANTALPVLSEIYLSSTSITGHDGRAWLTVVLNLLVVLDRLYHQSLVSPTSKFSSQVTSFIQT